MQSNPPSYPWLDELNMEQRQAVLHDDGPVLVVAGAGSGKTRTLAFRVACLVARGVDPERILLLTFTRRAAEEMVKRADEILSRGAGVSSRVWGGTFHAIANRLLRMYARSSGLNPDFTIMDQSDAEDLIDVVRHEMNLTSRDKRFPRKSTCLDIYSCCVNGKDALPRVIERYFPWCDDWNKELKELFRQYVIRKQDRNVLDYDDLLLYWARMLEDPAIAESMSGRFDHILVDEYQDTNPVQAAIMLGMRKHNRNIMVVGDDAQSIYSFRAATVRNMLDFPQQFPGTQIVTLDQNYRAVAPILDTTNRIIEQSRERYAKDLKSVRGSGSRPQLVMCKDEAQQDQYVIERVLEHYEQGVPLRRQAVLFRIGYLSDSLEIELARRKIPYHKYGGLRFLEAAHVKDLIAFLRILENPRDEIPWFRILQLLDGIGPASAARAIAHVAAHSSDPREILSWHCPPASSEGIQRLGRLIQDLYSQDSRRPASDVERIRRFYDPILQKIYDNPKVRGRDLESLERIAAGYKSRRSFLTDLMLDPPTSTSDLPASPTRDEDWLVLSTIHSAKGCEWDAVYLIHASDGCLPSDMATGSPEEIDEELRLAYVAMTRARDFLYVAWPLRYYHKMRRLTDRHIYAQPSRFLTPSVVQTMDSVTLVQEPEEDASPDISSNHDIRARIRSQWD